MPTGGAREKNLIARDVAAPGLDSCWRVLDENNVSMVMLEKLDKEVQ